MKSDMDRFIELYKSIGVECRVEEGRGEYALTLHATKECPNTGGFHTVISFDKDEKFVQQFFWE